MSDSLPNVPILMKIFNVNPNASLFVNVEDKFLVLNSNIFQYSGATRPPIVFPYLAIVLSNTEHLLLG